MNRSKLANLNLLKIIFLLQFIPLILFPPSTFELKSQSWWLPMILVIMAAVGWSQIIRRSVAAWPLYLIAFAQGFNIISRLLMLMPQSTQNTGGGAVNVLYLTLSVIAMIWSTFMLWYIELPEVKQEITR
jgi:hypothetical protein